MQNLGYTDRNCYSSLGTLSLLITFEFFKYFLAAILKLIIYISGNKKDCLSYIYEKISNGLFFNNMLALLTEGGMEVLYSSYMNYKTLDKSGWGEYLG